MSKRYKKNTIYIGLAAYAASKPFHTICFYEKIDKCYLSIACEVDGKYETPFMDDGEYVCAVLIDKDHGDEIWDDICYI